MKKKREREKKIAEKVATILKAEGSRVPPEFALYRFCREFHCLPQEVMNMDDALYDLFYEFMLKEENAGTIANKRAQQRASYGH